MFYKIGLLMIIVLIVKKNMNIHCKRSYIVKWYYQSTCGILVPKFQNEKKTGAFKDILT